MNIKLHTRRRHRRGSTLILVVFASLMVAAIALASLNLDRVQGQAASDGNDFIEARSYARAGIEIGMLMIRNDPYWRTDLGNSPWVTNKAIGAGTFSLSAINPVSGDVTVGNNDPVILTSTGKKGRAQYLKSVRLEVGPSYASPFAVTMCSGQTTQVQQATLNCNQTVASDGNFQAGGSPTYVNANVEAIGQIQGATYTGTQTVVTTGRTMPDPVNAFNYYLANGTTINATSLPQWNQNTQLLTNEQFQTVVNGNPTGTLAGWYAVGTHTQIQLQNQNGSYWCQVKNRQLVTDSVAQDLNAANLALLKSTNSLNVQMQVLGTNTGTAAIALTVTNNNNVTTTFTGPAASITPNAQNQYNWTNVQATLAPNWTGTLTKATISLVVSPANANYNIDQVQMNDVTYPNNAYVMDRILLSPNSNPFGGSTNAQGIYIINCSGQTVAIGNSRIVGTLIFTNAGNNSIIQGPVVWEPAVANFPALMVSGNNTLTIATPSGSFSEANLGLNFNPSGTPYPYQSGTSNSTLTDSYPSQISGMVYSAGNLKFYNSPTINGVVIAASQIQVTNPPGNVGTTTMNLNYNNIYLNNPPPGFTSGTVTMKEVPGTWQRVVH